MAVILRNPTFAQPHRRPFVGAEVARNLLCSTLIAVAAAAPFKPANSAPAQIRKPAIAMAESRGSSPLLLSAAPARNAPLAYQHRKPVARQFDPPNITGAIPALTPANTEPLFVPRTQRPAVVAQSYASPRILLESIPTLPFKPPDFQTPHRRPDTRDIQLRNWIAERTAPPILPFFSAPLEAAKAQPRILADTSQSRPAVFGLSVSAPFAPTPFEAAKAEPRNLQDTSQGMPATLGITTSPFAAPPFESSKRRPDIFTETSQSQPQIFGLTIFAPAIAPPFEGVQRFWYAPADTSQGSPRAMMDVALPPIPTVDVAVDQPSGGYWPDYGQPGGKRKRRVSHETVVETTPQELEARLLQVAERIKTAKALRLAEARSRQVTEEIKAIYAEQDRLGGRIVAMKDALQRQEDDEIAMILALAG
jgi:hypothetical protein